jgi:hypothetical protein
MAPIWPSYYDDAGCLVYVVKVNHSLNDRGCDANVPSSTPIMDGNAAAPTAAPTGSDIPATVQVLYSPCDGDMGNSTESLSSRGSVEGAAAQLAAMRLHPGLQGKPCLVVVNCTGAAAAVTEQDPIASAVGKLVRDASRGGQGPTDIVVADALQGNGTAAVLSWMGKSLLNILPEEPLR